MFSQLIRFARVCSHIADSNAHNKIQSARHIGIIIFEKRLTKFYRQYYIQYRIEDEVGQPSETDLIKSQISAKTSRGKKDSTKRRHQRHHQRQPDEQLFSIQVVIG